MFAFYKPTITMNSIIQFKINFLAKYSNIQMTVYFWSNIALPILMAPKDLKFSINWYLLIIKFPIIFLKFEIIFTLNPHYTIKFIHLSSQYPLKDCYICLLIHANY